MEPVSAKTPALAKTPPVKMIAGSHVSLKNILYATDFSRYSDAALPFALSIARRYGSKIFAVHVVSLSPFANSSPTQAWQALVAQGVREAQETISRAEGRWSHVPHETLLRKGQIWGELSKLIEEKEIDLVVCGTHGRSGVSKILMGSVAEDVYRHAPCPVLTIGPNVVGEPESIGDIHTILYATDFSPESLAAVPYAVSLAHENQARLYLLHVTETPVSPIVERELAGRLGNLVPPDAELECAPKAFVDFGEPARKIAELAEELRVDLIVLGPRRSSRLASLSHLPRSTAHYVVSKAICPVLTVREPLRSSGSQRA
jgi:nucleotide-binding universal stress UspA family protein